MTWLELLEYLKTRTYEQLSKEIEIYPPNCDDTLNSYELHCVVSCKTIGELELERTRSVVDNKHHPENLVLLTDLNMHDEDGSIGEDLKTGIRIFPNDNSLVIKVPPPTGTAPCMIMSETHEITTGNEEVDEEYFTFPGGIKIRKVDAIPLGYLYKETNIREAFKWVVKIECERNMDTEIVMHDYVLYVILK